MLTHGISPDFRGGAHWFIPPNAPSDQFRVYRVMQLRTDVIHCRESAGTGPVILKFVPVKDAALAGHHMDQFMCASIFPHPLYYYWYEV